MTKVGKQDKIKMLKNCRFAFREKLSLSYDQMRACTGFDGGFEVEEAIRRLRDCVSTWNLNINANNNKVALAA